MRFEGNAHKIFCLEVNEGPKKGWLKAALAEQPTWQSLVLAETPTIFSTSLAPIAPKMVGKVAFEPYYQPLSG